MKKQISNLASFGEKLSVSDMKLYKGGSCPECGGLPLYWYCSARVWANICYVNDPEGCSNECGEPCMPDMNGCQWV